jgi:hypothetical protein
MLEDEFGSETTFERGNGSTHDLTEVQAAFVAVVVL